MLRCGPEVRFQLASVSKQFTAAAVLMLADRKTLSVDDAVHRWIDGCPDPWRSMTIQHLLTHTSGLPHWNGLPAITLATPMDPDEQLSIIRSAQLRSSPGQVWSYSSPGYVLLAHIIQRAADRRYGDFLVEEIFQPLGLATIFVGNARRRALVATDHVQGVAVSALELDVVGMGAGDVWSTAKDVLTWDRALIGQSLLSDDSTRAMFASHVDVFDSPTHGQSLVASGYGFGWFIGRFQDRRAFFHPGDNAGSVAMSVILPDDDCTLVVLSNEARTPVDSIVASLLEPSLS